MRPCRLQSRECYKILYADLICGINEVIQKARTVCGDSNKTVRNSGCASQSEWVRNPSCQETIGNETLFPMPFLALAMRYVSGREKGLQRCEKRHVVLAAQHVWHGWAPSVMACVFLYLKEGYYRTTDFPTLYLFRIPGFTLLFQNPSSSARFLRGIITCNSHLLNIGITTILLLFVPLHSTTSTTFSAFIRPFTPRSNLDFVVLVSRTIQIYLPTT